MFYRMIPLEKAALPGEPMSAIAYLAPEEWLEYVQKAVGVNARQYGRLLVKDGPINPCHWAQNIWLEPRLITYTSINDAARQLRSIQRNWCGYSNTLHRRTALIEEALPHISRKPRVFPFDLPTNPIGAFMLIDEHTMIASATCSSPFPGGEIVFEENKVDPPSSAYLKMWEALTRLGRRPGPGSHCIDAGACPGGWTWVLDQLGADVLALDRSPLAPALMASPRVRFRSGNAFAVTPATISEWGWNRVEWLCSDLICYPEKLLEWVRLWLDSGKVDNCVITLKMQGEPDWKTIDEFAAIPGGTVYHANYNKHELTWIWPTI